MQNGILFESVGVREVDERIMVWRHKEVEKTLPFERMGYRIGVKETDFCSHLLYLKAKHFMKELGVECAVQLEHIVDKFLKKKRRS